MKGQGLSSPFSPPGCPFFLPASHLGIPMATFHRSPPINDRIPKIHAKFRTWQLVNVADPAVFRGVQPVNDKLLTFPFHSARVHVLWGFVFYSFLGTGARCIFIIMKEHQFVFVPHSFLRNECRRPRSRGRRPRIFFEDPARGARGRVHSFFPPRFCIPNWGG